MTNCFFRTVTFGEPMLIPIEYTHSYKMNNKPLWEELQVLIQVLLGLLVNIEWLKTIFTVFPEFNEFFQSTEFNIIKPATSAQTQFWLQNVNQFWEEIIMNYGNDWLIYLFWFPLLGDGLRSLWLQGHLWQSNWNEMKKWIL